MRKIGVWLMPDNEQTGELEDLFRTFIPAQDSLLRLADEIIDELEAT
jgi:hypothetical protein